MVEEAPIRFKDGASYDAMMGGWSRAVGEQFLDWLRPAEGLEWIDVGCGSGAFTDLIVRRCAPKSVLGIDPSEAQLDFARTRGLDPTACFEAGDAMALEVADASQDVAVAALVVHFMPDPAKGIREMARVVKPGGLVAAYAWDLAGGGFPYEAIHTAMRSMGLAPPDPPSPEAANADELVRLWRDAGLQSLQQSEFSVSQAFREFDHYWETATSAPRIAARLSTASDDVLSTLKGRVHAALKRPQTSEIAVSARANAIAGLRQP
jgi:ubiquinone/menaquinone biosynthesis C-methylase UbiE